jgi:hypothetical protein
VDIRNSIVVAEELETVACADISVETSAVQDMDILAGNTDMGMWNTSWFQDVTGHDFHLGTAQAELADIARWMTGDPAADIDGDPRPTVNDTAHWPGADAPN